MNENSTIIEATKRIARRRFLTASAGVGAAAFAWLAGRDSFAEALPGYAGAAPGLPHFAPRAKRVIFLHQSGAPSQVDLFDYKPELSQRHGEEIPDSIRMGQRLTTMTADQEKKPFVGSPYRFARHGQGGAEFSELLPHTAAVADELCIVKSLFTEAINHDPAITFMHTGSQQPGRPSFGSWVSYGLGKETDELPAFLVMISGGEPGDQPLFGRLWGSGFLPASHQGVKLRAAADPVLYLHDPPGLSAAARRRFLDGVAKLDRLSPKYAEASSEIETRLDQFETAFRMQASVPELADLSTEPEATFDLYGPDAKKPGTFAANCLLARRLAERGVRFIQLYHRDWDHHKNLPGRLPEKCRQTDQPAAALVADLRQRGLLDETLVVWAGEFGRTAYCQGDLSQPDWGRDHHPRCFTIWLAGGGVRSGATIGATDDFSYNITADPIHVHDLQATILHLLGIDHERLTWRHQGRDYRLTDVGGVVAEKLLR